MALQDDYIRDCFIHTLLYRDRDGKPLADIAMLQAHLTDASLPLPVRVLVMSHRVGVSETARDNGALAGALGDALVAILGSAIDWEQDGATVDAWIEGRSATRLENMQV